MQHPVTRRAVPALALAAVLLLGSGTGARADPVVVELFTSQGCNSCPPADRVLGELAARDDVVALSFHVTYWDRLGWPDTFGLEASTGRQDRYAEWFGARRLYTPQMVIGGRVDVVGSRGERVRRAIELIKANAKRGPDIALRHGRVTVGEGPAEAATIWLFAFDAAHDVPIDRGENAGRTLRYHRVVRELIELGRWRGQADAFDLPLGRLSAEGRDGIAIVLQRERDGAILAATENELEAR